MVAAWISAETGVGPSMASGSQICSGNMADLPAPPMKISIIDQVITDKPRKLTEAIPAKTGLCGLVSSCKIKSTGIKGKHQYSDQESQVGKTGNNKCFFGCSNC